MPSTARRWYFGQAELRPDERRLLVRGTPAAIGARAFDLLVCLVEHRDRVLGRDELLERVWPGLVVEESNLTVQVAALRKLLGRDLLATVPGRGYQFTAALQEAPAAFAQPTAPPPAADEQPTLAVMPFANLSGDAAEEPFVDGIVDDLTGALSRVRRFFVIARSSAFTYKGRIVDVPQVGRELGVRYVVEGSFRRAGERLRIGVQLVETGAGRQLWAQRFEGQRADVFALQDEITAQVVGAIEPRLVRAEVERVRQHPTDNVAAYTLCLEALPQVMRSGSAAEVEQALALLARAVAVDPGYSYARALHAWGHVMALCNGLMPRAQALRALPWAEQAQVEHRDDPSTLAFAGHARSLLAHHHQEGLLALDHALALNPDSTVALRSSGWVRTYVGDIATAIDHLHRAIQLNPLDPELGFVLAGFSFACLHAGRHADALGAARRATSEQPAFVPAWSALLQSLAANGLWDEAQALFARRHPHGAGYTLAQWRAGMPWRSPGYLSMAQDHLRRLGVAPE